MKVNKWDVFHLTKCDITTFMFRLELKLIKTQQIFIIATKVPQQPFANLPVRVGYKQESGRCSGFHRS